MTFTEFINMGGYAFYVWSAYGVVASLLILNTAIPIIRHRRLLRRTRALFQERR